MRADSPGLEWKEEWAEKCNAKIVWIKVKGGQFDGKILWNLRSKDG